MTFRRSSLKSFYRKCRRALARATLDPTWSPRFDLSLVGLKLPCATDIAEQNAPVEYCGPQLWSLALVEESLEILKKPQVGSGPEHGCEKALSIGIDTESA